MARTRILKPEFFSSRSLSRVSRDARLLFQGLWCEADSAGRGKADPRIVKGAVFPLDDDLTTEIVHALLCKLHDTDHIVLYEVDEEPLFEVVNFAKHQAASYRSGDPKYPGPDDPGAIRATCTSEHATCTPSLALREGKGREGKRIEVDAHAQTDDGFDDWWRTYPRKVDKKRARSAWRNLTKTERDDSSEALPAHIRSWANTKPEHIPHPTTWLNGRRWEDDLEPTKPVLNVVRDGLNVAPNADW